MVASGTRREARERAVELLYEADTKGVRPAAVIDALPLPTDAYAIELANGVFDHRIEIDRILDRYSQRWSVGRMAAMDRTVLRLGVFELATKPEVPTGVCLAEAVELGAQYGSTDDTSKFVNGMLARIAEELRDADGDPAWLPIDVVVFDMDGVIRHWGDVHIAAFEEANDLAPGSVASIAFADPDFRAATVGELSADGWAASIGDRLAQAHAQVDADEAAAMWLGTDWSMDAAVVDLIRSIRGAGQRTAVFSNATTRLEQDMATMGIVDLFDDVANSARLGLAKPDVAAFEAVADLLAVRPERLLFVDDRPENVGGAVDAGWHAVQMQGAGPLADTLARLQIPGAARIA